MQVAEQAEEVDTIRTFEGCNHYWRCGVSKSWGRCLIQIKISWWQHRGRLLQYIQEENFDCRAVEILIFDETDRMLQMGFGQDAEKIAAETRWRKQTLLFSATLEGELLVDFADRLLNDPVKSMQNSSRRERKKINQWYYHADSNEHKIKVACAFYRNRERESRHCVCAS